MTGRRTVNFASGAVSFAMTPIATAVISASAPATRPRGTAASNCQSSYVYDGSAYSPTNVDPAIGKYTANATVDASRPATSVSAKRAAFGRAISSVRTDARIGDDSRPHTMRTSR